MFEALSPTIHHWLPPMHLGWRLSTWWPSDSIEAMQRSLLQLLAVSHQERLELVPLLQNFADEHRGRYRRRLHQLARLVDAGTPLVEAMEQTPDVLRDEDVLAIRFASQTGTLGPTYDSLVSRSPDVLEHDRSIQRQHWTYAAATLVVLSLILTFLWVFIIPTLRHIQDEFALESHPLFQIFTDVVDWITRFAPLLILGIAMIAFLVWARSSRQFLRRFFAARWIRSVAQKRSSQLLQLLATSVEAGRPVPTSISTLARYHFDPNVRQKLLFARNEMEQGHDVWLSLVEAGLLTPQEATAIVQAPSNPSRAWAMRELADWRLHQASSRQLNFSRWLQPLLTLLFAAVVLLVAGAMMGFLSQMVHSLAQP